MRAGADYPWHECQLHRHLPILTEVERRQSDVDTNAPGRMAVDLWE
jgi:hypothetical protein